MHHHFIPAVHIDANLRCYRITLLPLRCIESVQRIGPFQSATNRRAFIGKERSVKVVGPQVHWDYVVCKKDACACRRKVKRVGGQSKKNIKGERGIRTLGDCEATLVFKTNALNRSATSPWYSSNSLKQKSCPNLYALLFYFVCCAPFISFRVKHTLAKV